MIAIKPSVADCFDRFKRTGRFEVAVTAAPDGALEQVHVRGDDPETAGCIENVARQQLHMPPADSDDPYSIVYPFIFR